MNELHIIDVSALVYVGSTSKYLGELSNYGFPVGGLQYLMRQVSTCLGLADPVVLCFDSPSKRKEIYDGYKSGRGGNPAVYSQIQFAFESLMAAGFRCEKYDGYEADDIVGWAVDQMKHEYYEITIVGNDHDLCHNIQQGVRFKSIAPGSACIYEGNFEEMVDSTYTAFNTISAKKAICGCKSDSIPAVRPVCGLRPQQVYGRFLEFLREAEIPFTYNTTTDYRALVVFVNESGIFSDTEKEEMFRNIRLAYPLVAPDDVKIKPVLCGNYSKEGMSKFLTMINDNDSLKCLGLKRTHLSEDDKEKLRDMGRKLSSGEYAADNNLEVESKANVRTLNLSSFTKEF